MKRLLLRSNKNEHFDVRVDVAFQDVQAVQLPTLLSGLTIAEANDAEGERISNATGLLPNQGHTFFSLSGSNFTGYVVAGVVATTEDSGEYYEPTRAWAEDPSRLG